MFSVVLRITGPYVVASGETVDLRASVGIKLTTGFQADAGAEFRATLDPLAGGNQVTGTGDIAYNRKIEGQRSVKLGPDSALETGRVSGRVTARADFHPGSTSSGKTVIMAFEDGADHVRMVYENGSVKLESSIDGTAASSAFVPGYNRSWPWARVEMELLPSGTVNAWMYGYEDTRFKGAKASVTVPADWTLFSAPRAAALPRPPTTTIRSCGYPASSPGPHRFHGDRYPLRQMGNRIRPWPLLPDRRRREGRPDHQRP